MRYLVTDLFSGVAFLTFFSLTFYQCTKKPSETLPVEYKQSGSFIKSLPYYNPDSCVLLIRRDVPPKWQGAAYENLYLDGPEDSPMSLAYQHLETYEKNFPADSARAFAQLYRGQLLAYDNHLDSARACLNEAYEISQRLGDRPRSGDVQEALAGIYYREGKTPEAIRAFLAVYEAVQDLDSSHVSRKITAMMNLASAYSQSKNDREALAWAQRSFQLAEDETNPALRERKVSCLLHLSVIYDRLGEPDSAILLAQNGLELQKKYQTANDPTRLMLAIGSAYLTKENCPAALEQLLATRRIKQDRYIETELAKAYLCVGQLDSAEFFYKRGLNTPSATTLSEVNTRLSEIYARQGRYQLAYDAIKASLEFREKNFNVLKVQEIGAVKAELELERSRHQLVELDQQRKTARLQYLLGGLLLLSGLLFLLALFLRQRGRRRILEQQNCILEQDKELAVARELLKAKELEQSQTSLKITQKELDNTARLLALKNQLIQELEMQLNVRHLAPTDTDAPHSAGSQSLHSMKILTDADWSLFRNRFEENFPGYLGKLKSNHPALTAAEIRLFLLMKLNFDKKEIAETLGISQESVWRSRHRLTKKLGLKLTGELDDFIHQFSNPSIS